MSMLNTDCVQGFIRLCDDGWRKGWHERNGGNLTYRMSAGDVEVCKTAFNMDTEWIPLDIQAGNLAGEHFITTGTGCFFRNIASASEANIGIVELNETGKAYRIVWGLQGGKRPTSELPSHLLNHSARKDATTGCDRVIYHAHTPNLIAMTYVLPMMARDFTRALWKSATECAIVFPNGVGVLPWMVPGGAGIAEASRVLMTQHDAVVWAHHGLFCAGPDFDQTFGLMDTIEKAAEVFVKIASMGKDILQTITDDQLRKLAEAFDVELNKQFLN